MSQLHWHCMGVRLAGVLAFGLAGLGQAAVADDVRLAADSPAPPELARPAVDVSLPPDFGIRDAAANDQLAMAIPSPGLQFSLDPDREEVFLGWQFEF